MKLGRMVDTPIRFAHRLWARKRTLYVAEQYSPNGWGVMYCDGDRPFVKISSGSMITPISKHISVWLLLLGLERSAYSNRWRKYTLIFPAHIFLAALRVSFALSVD